MKVHINTILFPVCGTTVKFIVCVPQLSISSIPWVDLHVIATLLIHVSSEPAGDAE
jgi:hypothetical protein